MLCQRCHSLVARAVQYLDQSLRYRAFIVLMLESYQGIVLAILIQLRDLRWDSYGTVIQSLFCLFFAVLAIVGPITLLFIVIRDFDKLDERQMRQKYGAFYEGLRLKAGKKVFLQIAFFMKRRLVMAFVIVVCKDELIAQIYLIWAQTAIASMIIGYATPFESPGKRWAENLNEFVIYCVFLTMICLSYFVPNPEDRVNIGYFLCALIGLYVVVSIAVVTYMSCIEKRNTCRRKVTMRKR